MNAARQFSLGKKIFSLDFKPTFCVEVCWRAANVVMSLLPFWWLHTGERLNINMRLEQQTEQDIHTTLIATRLHIWTSLIEQL